MIVFILCRCLSVYCIVVTLSTITTTCQMCKWVICIYHYLIFKTFGRCNNRQRSTIYTVTCYNLIFKIRQDHRGTQFCPHTRQGSLVDVSLTVGMQRCRQVCKSGGAGMLLCIYMQIFGYSPLKMQCTLQASVQAQSQHFSRWMTKASSPCLKAWNTCILMHFVS